MRRPTFWEAFWMLAIFLALVGGGVVGGLLTSWLQLPWWVAVTGPFLGLAALYAIIVVLVMWDDGRRRGRSNPDDPHSSSSSGT